MDMDELFAVLDSAQDSDMDFARIDAQDGDGLGIVNCCCCCCCI